MAHAPILALGGPTSSGKSSVALALARRLLAKGKPAEILCADSITHYRGFDIGAAKPTAAERAEIPHHLLDICAPADEFTAGDFVRAADAAIVQIHARGAVPILVGGSGFYVKALLRGMATSDDEDPEAKRRLRAELEERLKAEGAAALYAEMLGLDPALASRIHLNDTYRILRALEAMRLSGKSWSEANREAEGREDRYPEARFFAIDIPMDALEARIALRTRAMLDSGLVREVEELLRRGVAPTAKPMLSVGYRQTLEYLGALAPEGDEPRPDNPEALALAIQRATRKLAKSQRTWLRGQKPAPHWIPAAGGDPTAEILACVPSL